MTSPKAGTMAVQSIVGEALAGLREQAGLSGPRAGNSETTAEPSDNLCGWCKDAPATAAGKLCATCAVCAGGCGRCYPDGKPYTNAGRLLYCVDCHPAAAVRLKSEREIESARREAAGVQDALDQAGFKSREQSMTLGSLRVSASVRAALEAWARDEKALYIYGRDTGTGKTHAAVAALKRRIVLTGECGLFLPVPLLVKDLRQAIGRFQDGELIDRLISTPALVLDDIGVERPTETVIEALYTVIDGWYRDMRAPLIITGNLSPDDLSLRLGDRIVSRIVGHCRVLEFSGQDRRLSGQG